MQLSFDFKRKIVNGKKTERLCIPCSEEFLKVLDLEAGLLRTDRARLAHRFVTEGMQKELGNLFISEPYLNEKLGDLMST
jgi:hypothetical protein